jgi:hypothetical protein
MHTCHCPPVIARPGRRDPSHLDVERLPDLLGRLALDHLRHRLARQIQEALDVEVIGSLYVSNMIQGQWGSQATHATQRSRAVGCGQGAP